MSNLYVEVDDDALSAAASILGTTTKKDTVNAALREVSQRHRRLTALEELAAMGERGDFDILLDKDNYRR
ncbi:type II toxin-antitoxin system VapB family antitoxin [Streptomyces sp. A3M-1-3]|uniref:type II toxin-antitoxin system VapB family antitoxin n=1 Tax=Streptomyces sp. A3M-1-3 TaxID=2962044 RepID=UPI0020B7FA69|nr:type II toxin-antitoxin system VapB family antitoxin [Streptomyces sp. A3M-1-3]MCP3819583.1 type II toxin-antitoxin system VapB family antitoxin [Streptomyces sp. A3M-1-3]